MALEALIDDTNNTDVGGDWFILGGFIASAERWAKFADEWQSILGKAPYPIEYYKSSEAFRLKGQFEKWSEAQRDQLHLDLASLIKDAALHRIGMKISHSEFHKQVRSLPVPARLHTTDFPAAWLYTQLLIAIASVVHSKFPGEVCDVIFDEQQALDVELNRMWGTYNKALSDKFSVVPADVIPNPPIFRDDKTFVPLQAADLFVGAARREYRGEVWPQLDAIGEIDGGIDTLGEDALGEIRDGMLRLIKSLEQTYGIEVPLEGYTSAKQAKRSRDQLRKLKRP